MWVSAMKSVGCVCVMGRCQGVRVCVRASDGGCQGACVCVMCVRACIYVLVCVLAAVCIYMHRGLCTACTHLLGAVYVCVAGKSCLLGCWVGVFTFLCTHSLSLPPSCTCPPSYPSLISLALSLP